MSGSLLGWVRFTRLCLGWVRVPVSGPDPLVLFFLEIPGTPLSPATSLSDPRILGSLGLPGTGGAALPVALLPFDLTMTSTKVCCGFIRSIGWPSVLIPGGLIQQNPKCLALSLLSASLRISSLLAHGADCA